MGFGTNALVSLGEFGELTVTSNTDTEIVADLPGGLSPGEFTLIVMPDSNPDYMTSYSLTVGAEALPAGMTAFFASSDCPAGWTAVAGARGRVIVGLPLGGSPGGVVGTGLTNLENRTHDHDLSLSAGDTGMAGDHNHTGLVQITEHAHTGPTTTEDATTSYDCDDGFKCGGPALNHTHGGDANMGGAHSHIIQGDTGHTHSIGGSNSTSSTASTSEVTPYVQLLACSKD